MFVVIVQFPPVREGKDGEFLEWFAWSNGEFAKSKGFIGRVLLKPEQGGGYASIVSMEQGSNRDKAGKSAHSEAGKRVRPLLRWQPTPTVLGSDR